jgi:hypothetical protein
MSTRPKDLWFRAKRIKNAGDRREAGPPRRLHEPAMPHPVGRLLRVTRQSRNCSFARGAAHLHRFTARGLMSAAWCARDPLRTLSSVDLARRSAPGGQRLPCRSPSQGWAALYWAIWGALREGAPDPVYDALRAARCRFAARRASSTWVSSCPHLGCRSRAVERRMHLEERGCVKTVTRGR